MPTDPEHITRTITCLRCGLAVTRPESWFREHSYFECPACGVQTTLEAVQSADDARQESQELSDKRWIAFGSAANNRKRIWKRSALVDVPRPAEKIHPAERHH